MTHASRPSVDRTFAALADPDRRRAIDLLRERPRRAGELAAALRVSAPAMSRHLRVLRQSGLVRESHPHFDARVRIYSLQAGPITEVREWLELAERGWSEQLVAFKTHLEGRPKSPQEQP